MKNEIPKWLKNHLDQSGLQTIADAIETAEQKTSGELVLMIVRSSSTIGHVPVVLFCLLFIAILLFNVEAYERDLGHAFGMWPLINAAVCAFLTYLLARLTFVQRLLIPKADRVLQVQQRAELEFYRLGIGNTVGSTGILLLVSLMEKRIEVKADKGIAGKLPAETWSEVVILVLNGIDRGEFADGLTAAMTACGELLVEHFPISADDRNELSNHIIITE